MSAFVGTLQIRTFDTSAACADINIARQYVNNRMFIRVNDKTQEKNSSTKEIYFPAFDHLLQYTTPPANEISSFLFLSNHRCALPSFLSLHVETQCS